jgi:hypothetical protein
MLFEIGPPCSSSFNHPGPMSGMVTDPKFGESLRLHSAMLSDLFNPRLCNLGFKRNTIEQDM